MMKYINLRVKENIATIILNRPKVNALNKDVIDELKATFEKVRYDGEIKAIVLTGEGSFFSFGFDVPEFMSCGKEEFRDYVHSYSELVKLIFMFPMPVVAALNGHAVAGGAVLAMACDFRIMVSEKAKIALNEMTFGSTLFSCVTETLRYSVGSKKSERIIYSGKMHGAREALEIGLVDNIASVDEFSEMVYGLAKEYASKDLMAFTSIKTMLKHSTLYQIEKYETETISEFVEVWYSDSTREMLAQIQIRD